MGIAERMLSKPVIKYVAAELLVDIEYTRWNGVEICFEAGLKILVDVENHEAYLDGDRVGIDKEDYIVFRDRSLN